jgi:hypothetical protein
VSDPDGNKWEVFVVLGNSEDKDIASSTCCTPVVKPVSIGR